MCNPILCKLVLRYDVELTNVQTKFYISKFWEIILG